MNKGVNIAIVTTMPFPSGAASVNRILSYSKGLVELGDKVTVYSTYFSEGGQDYKYIDGIRYKCLRGKQKKSRLNSLLLLFALIRLLIVLGDSRDKFDAVILVSNSLLIIYPVFLACKAFSIKLIQEKSEYPFVLKNRSLPGRVYAKLYISTTYRLFDGMVIMTTSLERFFKNLTKTTCKKIVLPMTVDASRFQISAGDSEYEYIAYCGDIGGNKDGVKNLITAFSLIESKYPDLKLLLIGGSKNPEERKKLEIHASQLNVRNVCFYGQVDRDQIPGLLCKAKLLALARPGSLQSEGGFPTKLGEYLSTGKPVVATMVGDIPLYLRDGENAFLVEPDDNEKFAEKISYVMDNYEHALQVSKNGQKVVDDVFNYKVQSGRLHDFLLDFIRR